METSQLGKREEHGSSCCRICVQADSFLVPEDILQALCAEKQGDCQVTEEGHINESEDHSLIELAAAPPAHHFHCQVAISDAPREMLLQSMKEKSREK